MRTKNGIELDLKESKYKSNFNGYEFYFSSEFYKYKFEERLTPYIMVENAKIKNKYGVRIFLHEVLAISLYKNIEKRGFRVVNCYTGDEITENATFTLEQVVL